MMEKIYSKKEPSKLLHLVYRQDDKEEEYRRDLVEPENFIQCATINNMPKGRTFAPHRHIYKKRNYEKFIAQESWLVVKGSVKCIFYDVDDEILATPVLFPGDASFTLHGGHTYEVLEEGTTVFEYKTGPYEGQANDKVPL